MPLFDRRGKHIRINRRVYDANGDYLGKVVAKYEDDNIIVVSPNNNPSNRYEVDAYDVYVLSSDEDIHNIMRAGGSGIPYLTSPYYKPAKPTKKKIYAGTIDTSVESLMQLMINKLLQLNPDEQYTYAVAMLSTAPEQVLQYMRIVPELSIEEIANAIIQKRSANDILKSLQ